MHIATKRSLIRFQKRSERKNYEPSEAIKIG